MMLAWMFGPVVQSRQGTLEAPDWRFVLIYAGFHLAVLAFALWLKKRGAT